MPYTAKQYAIALYQAIFESHPDNQDKILDNFTSILRKNNDLHLMDGIEQEFFIRERESRGIKLAEVKSAKPLSQSDEERIVRELNEYVGGQVELKKQVDEGVLGGVVIRVGDEIIDGSIKRGLEDLKSKLSGE
jgi:F-type H+-transporting ATPase subunit delta